jgi:hypothetical protein
MSLWDLKSERLVEALSKAWAIAMKNGLAKSYYWSSRVVVSLLSAVA